MACRVLLLIAAITMMATEVDGVACALSMWSAWSECSATCGTGVQSRVRSIIVHPTGDQHCQPTIENRKCNQHPCADPCSDESNVCTDAENFQCATDGRTYINKCHFEQAKCENSKLFVQHDGPCDIPDGDCHVTAWTVWSACEGGVRHRERHIIMRPSENGTACPSNLTETMLCDGKSPKPPSPQPEGGSGGLCRQEYYVGYVSRSEWDDAVVKPNGASHCVPVCNATVSCRGRGECDSATNMCVNCVAPWTGDFCELISQEDVAMAAGSVGDEGCGGNVALATILSILLTALVMGGGMAAYTMYKKKQGGENGPSKAQSGNWEDFEKVGGTYAQL